MLKLACKVGGRCGGACSAAIGTWAAIACFVWLSGCTVIPTDAVVNEPAQSSQALGPGTFNATMAVPWQLDLQCARDSKNCPSAADIVACRRWLFYGGEGAPCNAFRTDNNFVGLTLSGGGSRSAVLSAALMFEMQRVGLLHDVDVVSSVSGGSLTAALYAASCDGAADCQPNVENSDLIRWREDKILGRLQYDFMDEWWQSFLYNPAFLAKEMTTYFNRNDVMADVLADRLFPNSTGFLDPNDGLTFAQLNPRRPNVVIGATDMTTSKRNPDLPGRCFQFTVEHFLGPGRTGIARERNINSDLDGFPLAYAVLASNAFPGLFQYESLRDWAESAGKARYVHLADGGVRDQVALVPVNSILKGMLSPRGRIVDTCDVTRGEDDRSELKVISDGRRILLFVIDASVPPSGADEFSPDARSGPLDYLPLGKALDAVDAIIDDQRSLRAAEFVETRHKLTAALGGDPSCCVVVVFSVHDYLEHVGPRTRPSLYNYPIEKIDPKLYRQIIDDMPLGLNISRDNVCVLRRAARSLMARMTAELCSGGYFLDRGIGCDAARSTAGLHPYDCG